MFGGPPKAVRRVEGTKIFARSLPTGRQILVYSMNVAARAPVAMILPLPVPPSPAEDALRFIDLKGYPGFFRDLDRAFPPLIMPASRGGLGGGPVAGRAQRLVVHEVGDFVASFVPHLDDFDRLDPRFRLDERVWAALPQHADFGFAVFQLADLGMKRGLGRLLGLAQTKTIHPMAFEFPRRNPAALFFPTVHVHDGEVHGQASFDHHLYAQLVPGRPPPDNRWLPNADALGEHLDRDRCRGVIDFDAPAYSQTVMGTHANEDIVLDA